VAVAVRLGEKYQKLLSFRSAGAARESGTHEHRTTSPLELQVFHGFRAGPCRASRNDGCWLPANSCPVAVIIPFAAERVIEIAVRQRLSFAGRLTVSSSRASRRLLSRPDLYRLQSRRKRLVYSTIRIQALEQFSRRADGRQLAAPRGLHRLDGFLVRNQRLERESWPRGKAGAEPRRTY
jgi:hypothetical protein